MYLSSQIVTPKLLCF